MNQKLKKRLINLAKKHIDTQDAAHDMSHVLRVLKNAEQIQKHEGGNLDIIVPAALFHDVVNLPKDSPLAAEAPKKSAEKAVFFLGQLDYFAKSEGLLQSIREVIQSVSYRYGKETELLEAKIVKDADLLEATGAISIMRTFVSTGRMNAKLYNIKDPFCKKRQAEPLKFGLDLFFTRLLKVKNKMHTQTAKEIAAQRTQFLYEFLDQLNEEISS
jgi:uncharacterized protein